jgi:hypothetical protein
VCRRDAKPILQIIYTNANDSKLQHAAFNA